jgi:hypothetical protein
LLQEEGLSRPPTGFKQYAYFRSVVEKSNACALPGCSINYEKFLTCMWRAVSRGYVHKDKADFVAAGLRDGFTAGVAREKLSGHRYFRNYPSAIEARGQVVDAIRKRVVAAKTLDLGEWTPNAEVWLHQMFDSAYIFPMGAVPKGRFDPEDMRPTDDHSRTLLNEATDKESLSYSLEAHKELAWFLKLNHVMAVADVEGAFPILPLAVWLWAFMLFRFFAKKGTSRAQNLYLHMFGDFGAAGMPGTFKIFFVDVVLQMARSELVLTLPLVVYVDDLGMVGKPHMQVQVNEEMVRLQDWCEEVPGVYFKRKKNSPAAEQQLYVGFIWDSSTLTRTLEERNLCHYIELLAEVSSKTVLTLQERQSCAGKMQRAIMTLPPGAACLLSNMYHNMRGLRLHWQRRRTNRAERRDVSLVHDLLKLNVGRGHYSYDLFDTAPTVWGDACKGSSYVGGGYFSSCGRYRFWHYWYVC